MLLYFEDHEFLNVACLYIIRIVCVCLCVGVGVGVCACVYACV